MNEIVVLSGAEQDLIGHYCRLEELREGAGTAFDHAINAVLHMRQDPATILALLRSRLPR